MPEKNIRKHQLANAPSELGTEDIGRLLFRFSVPAIVGLLCNAMQNIINRIFVGNAVGSEALGAVAIVFPIWIIFIAISGLIGIGGSTLTAMRLGQGRNDEAEELLGQSIVLLFLIPAVLYAVGIWYIEPILVFFGATETILPYAKDYLSIILLAMVFACPSIGVNNFIRTEGSPKVSMYTQILVAAITIVLNYIFVIMMGWGVKGAALGVVIANFVSLFWIFGYFTSKKSFLKIRVRYFRIKLSLTRKIMTLGMASFLLNITNSIQQLILNRTVAFQGGDTALAVISIITGLSSLLILPMIGFNQAAQPIIGYNYGARNPLRIKDTLWKGMAWATVYAIISFVVVQIWAEPLVTIFDSGDAEVVSMAVHAIRIFFICLPLISLQMMSSGYFQAIGKPLIASVISLSRQVLVFIPILLILPNFMGIEGVWLAAPISDAVSFVVAVVLIREATRHLNGLIAEQY